MVLPTVLLPVQRMCFCVLGENVIFHVCMRIVFSFVTFSSSTMRNTCKSAKSLMAEILEPCICYQLYRFFYTSLTEMETETRVVSDKKKMRRHHKLLKTWKPFFSLLFLWMSCKGCFWVPNVCKARAMWRIVMGRIVSLFSSCTHLFRPFFHPCTDVVAAFTQPRWTFAKYEKWRRPKCLNRLWYFCVGSHKAERKIKKGA